jgi:hypothetical protein
VSTPDICHSIFRLLWIAIAWRGGDSWSAFSFTLFEVLVHVGVFHRLRSSP